MHKPATPGRCRGCRQAIVTGLDGELAAFTIRADPTPLTATGEAVALLLGLGTYALREGPDGGHRLFRRDRWQIGGKPAGTTHPLFPQDVVAEHQCGVCFVQYTTHSSLNANKPRSSIPNECPF